MLNKQSSIASFINAHSRVLQQSYGKNIRNKLEETTTAGKT